MVFVEVGWVQYVIQVFWFDIYFVFFFYSYFLGYVVYDVGNLVVEGLYVGFMGVGFDEGFQCMFVQFDLICFQAMFFMLFGYKVVFSNFYFFFGGVVVDLNDFYMVQQCGLNGVQGVGCSDEYYFVQVVFQFEVIVVKSFVLFWVQYFQQSRGGVVVEVFFYFIDFIQNKDWIG